MQGEPHQFPSRSRRELKGVNMEKMEAMRNELTRNGVFTTIRASRGQDIFAACGLLSTSKKLER